MNNQHREEGHKVILSKVKNILEKYTQKNSIEYVSAIIYGSYGRGEGSVYVKNGKYLGYNDIDIMFVVNRKISNIAIQDLKRELLPKLGVRWVDVSQIALSSLQRLKPSVFNYDLKYGSKVVLGDEGVLGLIPEIKSSAIPMKDVEVLYFTRLYTLLGSIYKGSFVDGITGENARYFRNQMAKAILAIVDVLLISKGKYHSSYKTRNSKIKTHCPSHVEIIKMADWALSEKLAPSETSMNGSSVQHLYEKVLRAYLDQMYFCLSHYYRRKIKSTRDIELSRYSSISEGITCLKHLVKNRSIHGFILQMKIDILQSYLVEAFLLDRESQKKVLETVKTKLADQGVIISQNDADWFDYKDIVTSMRLGEL